MGKKRRAKKATLVRGEVKRIYAHGGSHGVILGKTLLAQAGIDPKGQVRLTLEGKSIRIEGV